jgi:hypothetical protein
MFLYIKSQTVKCDGKGWDGESWDCEMDYTPGWRDLLYIPLYVRCGIQGGRTTQTLSSWVRTFRCMIPYNDGGRECSTDSVCEGVCKVRKSEVIQYCKLVDRRVYECPDSTKGECSSGLEGYNEIEFQYSDKNLVKENLIIFY